MNVKFLNTAYRPSDEKLRELEKMQEIIHYSRLQSYYEIRNDPQWMHAARIEELRRMYRSRWKVLSDEVSDLSEED